MIIEGLLTTTNEQGEPHVAPMGPVVNEELSTWTLRPFASSTTFRLLRANPHCVFHVIDDVVPVVESALGLATSLRFAEHTWSKAGEKGETPVAIWTIPTACHWYHLEVIDWDVSQERSQATARVLEQRLQRPFWGWNRAKHAVLEATILATRLHLVERKTIEEDLGRMQSAVTKTAGARELLAWELLRDFFATH